jgi:aminopeptidase N
VTTTIYKPILASDYKPSDYLIDSAQLYFDIHDEHTVVTAQLSIRKNPVVPAKNTPLILDGKHLELQSIKLNDKLLTLSDYQIIHNTLAIANVPSHFTLETKVIIFPQSNKRLSGLYQSGENLCTQCEPHGFRRITYFIDRPDVLTKFSATIEAVKTKYPVLLSNGNLVAKGELANDRHWVKWEDPSYKSAYLFALVAGKYEHLEDAFITKSGKKITLQIYANKSNLHQCKHAMQALKEAMRWEEINFNREYDLDIYMIVAIDDFNSGAMENKGLNLFNSDFILASPETATDTNYIKVSTTIAHEYFHNWTGNRITCRDWFQIGLKEGLTTFQEDLFAEDRFAPAIQRISEVSFLRTRQFAEDAGPLAHPVRLQSYIDINNFYTATVYHKSAEIARMLWLWLGPKKFRAIMEYFFTKFDGSAVTIEDFLDCAQKVSGENLQQFKLWYDQKGTPLVIIESHYDAAKQTLDLQIKQTSRFPEQKPFFIPLGLAAFTKAGDKIQLISTSPKSFQHNSTYGVIIKDSAEKFHFTNISAKPILSIARNFSAPVKVLYDYTDDDLLFLMTKDDDALSRWNASQELMTKIILKLCESYNQQQQLALPRNFVTAIKSILSNNDLDAALRAQLLLPPSESYLFDNMPIADVDGIFASIEFFKKELALHLQEDLATCYQKNHEFRAYDLDAVSIGKRALKNLCLHYLNYLDRPKNIELCEEQLKTADNLTDILGALTELANSKIYNCDNLLHQYYEKWKTKHIMVNKWLALNASIKLPGTLERIKKLAHDPVFAIDNPSKVLALFRTFATLNHINFHDRSGAGYEFLAAQIMHLDTFNPQLAVAISWPLTKWKQFDIDRQNLMRKQLEKILLQPHLSKNLYEVVSKAIV